MPVRCTCSRTRPSGKGTDEVRGLSFALGASCIAAAVGCSDESFSGSAADASSAEAGARDGGAGGVPCGEATCVEPEICCAEPSDASSLTGVFSNGARHCSRREQCPPTAVAIACDSPTFCGGDAGSRVCCINHQGRRFTSTECVAPSGCDSAGPHDMMCIPSGAACPAGMTCTRLTNVEVEFDNYLICVH